MTFLARLLAAALALPPTYYLPGREPETQAERAARIEIIVSAALSEAEAIGEEWPGTSEDLALALLAITWFESRHWALEVHDGRARGDRGASVCLAQVWSKDGSLVGTSISSTRRCMRKAAEILVLHAQRCRIRHIDEHQTARLFAAYGTGRTCHATRWADKRAGLWAHLKKRTGPPGSMSSSTAAQLSVREAPQPQVQ